MWDMKVLTVSSFSVLFDYYSSRVLLCPLINPHIMRISMWHLRSTCQNPTCQKKSHSQTRADHSVGNTAQVR